MQCSALFLHHNCTQVVVGNEDALACSMYSVLEFGIASHLSHELKKGFYKHEYSSNAISQEHKHWVCSCTWVQTLRTAPQAPSASRVLLVLPNQEGQEHPIVLMPWTPATNPACGTLTNSSADGRAAACLCRDLISLIHLVTK